ncbi:DNA alkylation repair protein [Peribacillus deserti]|uniref:DNA alkylation repair protein n=1 Tax=Peribacillus deserti TaxID=673318 RepID=A0A2N5M2X8_9BACI|nr:DNA alkylation repair protein [Peribacillus deserti]PLT28710.1 DNA alkylation repair protein [Peribacillus deserti]
MTQPYRCPNCKTNRSRFNLIEQIPSYVKIDPVSGSILEEIASENLSPYHFRYNGPQFKIQCGTCGTVGDEMTFAAFGAMK